MTDHPEDAKQSDTPDGPEKDPQSYETGSSDEADKDTSGDSDGRADGKQNAIVHEGGPADPPDDSNEHADAAVAIHQPDGQVAPHAGE